MVGAAADTEAVAEGTEAAEVTGPRAENHCQSHSFADCGFEGVYHWAATADGVRCPGMEAEVVATTGEVEEATAAVVEAVTAAAAVGIVMAAVEVRLSLHLIFMHMCAFCAYVRKEDEMTLFAAIQGAMAEEGLATGDILEAEVFFRTFSNQSLTEAPIP